jgi:hypothetical protein
VTAAAESSLDDNPEGCRAHAEQDRVRAGGMGTLNGQLRLKRSADAWDIRANELEALAETHHIRRTAAIDEWNEAERDEVDDDDDATGFER